MVVVTGASGHLGANLVRALVDQGREVRALVRKDYRALENIPVVCMQGDLDDLYSLRRAFEGAEVVYHSAANISLNWHDWPALEASNVSGVQNVVDACRACGVRRLIHFSSIHAFNQAPLDRALDEDRPLVQDERAPAYDRSKAAGEQVVRQAVEEGLDAVILNPTAIIGPFDYKPSHFGEALLALARGKMPALVDGGFDWVDARDVAWAALQAEATAQPGARYLISGKWAPVQNLAAVVERFTGKRVPRLVFSLEVAQLGLPFVRLFSSGGHRPLYTSVSLHALRANRQISHARASREFGYRPRPIEETVLDTLRWFKEVGYL